MQGAGDRRTPTPCGKASPETTDYYMDGCSGTGHQQLVRGSPGNMRQARMDNMCAVVVVGCPLPTLLPPKKAAVEPTELLHAVR